MNKTLIDVVFLKVLKSLFYPVCSITYTHLISQVLHLDKIYFVHVIPDFFFSKSAELTAQNTPQVAVPLNERIQAGVQEKVINEFGSGDKGKELIVEVLEGTPYQKILQWTSLKQVELLITGHKKKSEGSGLTARRIARHTYCNVLFVTENANPTISRILVPLDYSQDSAKALRTALYFKSRVPEVEIVAVNVVRFLPTDYYFGLDHNPVYRKAFINETKKGYKTFLDKYNFPEEDIQIVFLEDSFNNIARHLNEYTNEENFDLVIMGAQGHSAFHNFLYGSVTERFVDLCDETPVLVVR